MVVSCASTKRRSGARGAGSVVTAAASLPGAEADAATSTAATEEATEGAATSADGGDAVTSVAGVVISVGDAAGAEADAADAGATAAATADDSRRRAIGDDRPSFVSVSNWARLRRDRRGATGHFSEPTC